MNLARPYHMVKETWLASQHQSTLPEPPRSIRWWWGCLVTERQAGQVPARPLRIEAPPTYVVPEIS